MTPHIYLNRHIQRWFNDSSFSIRNFQRESYECLLEKLGKIADKKIYSLYEVYDELNKGINDLDTLIIPKITQFNKKDYAQPFLRPVKELAEYVQSNFSKEEILGFYVHGSLATLDYIENYSDFDTIVIIKKPVLQNKDWMIDLKKRLSKSNTFLYLLDPLQHHEHFVVTEYDMEAYSQPIFPSVLFGYAKEISKFENPLTISSIKTSEDAYGTMEEWFAYFRDPNVVKTSLKNSYYLKLYIQIVVMLPARFLQALTNTYLYKKYSFENARCYFTEDEWKIITLATEVRNKCPFKSIYPYAVRRFIGLNLHYKYLSSIHKKLDYSFNSKVLKIIGLDFHKHTKKLIDRMEFLLKESKK